jgi:hypothetical protein
MRGAATFLAQNLLIIACSLCSSSYELNGLCAIFLRPYSCAPSMAIFSSALWPCLTAIINFSLPHGKNRFHSAYTAIHASRRYWFSLRLTAIINFSLPHGKNQFHSAWRRFTPHGDINFSLPHGDNRIFFASRQESISFPLHGNLHHTALSIFSLPHGDNRFFFAPRKILLITHQGFFMRGIFSFLLHPFWYSQSRLQFIGAGVAFLAMPGDEQLLRPFWRSLTWMTGHALASDDPIKNSLHTSFKYRYKSFRCAFNKFEDPIQELSWLTNFSVWQITSEAWPAQFSCFPMASMYLTTFLWASSQFYSGVRLASALASA